MILLNPGWAPAYAAVGGVAPVVVQFASKLDFGAGNTVTCAFGSNVTNGNLAVVAAWAFTSGQHNPLTAAMCTRSSGVTVGTVTLDANAERTDGSNSNLVGLYSVPITGTGALTMAVNLSTIEVGSIFLCVAVAEVSTVDVSGTRVNATATANSTTNSSIVSGNVATGGAGIIFGACAPGNPYGTITLGEDGAFSLIAETENDSQENGSCIYRASASNITDSADWAAGTSCAWDAVAVAYKSSSP